MKKIIFSIISIVCIAVIGLFAFFYYEQPQFFHEPNFDTKAPAVNLESGKPAILVFSKTNGFRHKDGIQAARTLLSNIAAEQGWQIVITENGAIHNAADLNRFQVVIWANASGPLLLQEQREALRSYIENGGGFLGIHAAGDNSHADWPWYQDTILGTKFIGHTMIPHKQDATITLHSAHPVAAGLPSTWQHYDEWYAFDRSPLLSGATVVFNVDESSYKPGKYSMTPNHPVVWLKELKQGRTFYSALGHSTKSFDTPEYQQLLRQAIQWAGRFNTATASDSSGEK